jgi:archaellum component FlaC
MTSSPLLLGICAVAAGITGSLATYLLTPAAVAASTPGSEGLSPASGVLVSSQLEKLVTTTESLERRLSMLESSDRGTGRALVLADGERASDPEILAAVEAYMTKSSGDQGSVRDMVASTLSQIRDQEDIDRDIARDEREAAQLQARVDKLADDLGLYGDQSTQLYDALWNEGAKRDELRDAMREGTGDMEAVRDEMRGLRDETALSLEQFLTAEQIETYNASNTNRRGGAGGGGGRNGG